ncbi:MAG: DUF3021 family protein [Lachnospiraceae bacterium]
MIRKILWYAFCGIGIGAVISTACLWITGQTENTLSDTTGWLIASAIYGILSMIMELDRPAFWWRALIHCSLCAAVTVITAWALGDETGLGQTAKLVLPSFFIIYIGISFIIYLWERQCVKKLNKKLK